MPGFRCTCNIAARFNSTLAAKAMALLEKYDPEAYARLMREANEHIARLRSECRCYPEAERRFKRAPEVHL